jgi:1,4-dihydroxy-2-naphthoate octaprenyltransferase
MSLRCQLLRYGGDVQAVLAMTRRREWWDSKIALAAGVAYATAVREHDRLLARVPAIAAALLGLALAAVFVSLINDLSDLDLDRRSGKPNRLAGRTGVGVAAVVATVLAMAALAVLVWREHPLDLALYAGVCAAFTLYSVPPLRLKLRGLPGVLADAAGAHVLPHLLMVAVVLGDGRRPFAGTWVWAVGVWSAAYGVRGALWHQLSDLGSDRAVGAGTFARRHPAAARDLVVRVALPVELVALVVVMVLSRSPLPFAMLALYAAVVAEAQRRGSFLLTMLPAGAGYRILLHDFYAAYFAIGFLLAATLRNPEDVVIVAAHLLLFPAPSLLAAREAREELGAALVAVAARMRQAWL